jgi:tetratricopeptide (TPR) repeat protein
MPNFSARLRDFRTVQTHGEVQFPKIVPSQAHPRSRLRRHPSRAPEALEASERALSLLQRAHPPDHPDIAHALLRAASGLRLLGNLGCALETNEQAVEILRRALQPGHPDVLKAVMEQAEIRSEMGMHEDALALCEMVIREFQRVLPDGSLVTTSMMNRAAEICFAMGNYISALSYFEQVLRISRCVLPPDHPHVSRALFNTGKCHAALGRS